MYKSLLILLAGILFLGQTPRTIPQVENDHGDLIVKGFDDVTLSLYGDEGCEFDTVVSPPVVIPSTSLPMGEYLLVVNDSYNNQTLFNFNHKLKN